MTEKIITYHIWPRDISFENFVQWPGAFASKRGITKATYTFHQLKVNKYENISCRDTLQLAEILKRQGDFENLRTSEEISDPDNKSREFKVALIFSRDSIAVSFASSDIDIVNAAHADIKDQFNLRNPAIPQADPMRVSKLHATIFLGRHFDTKTGVIASKLNKFLSLIGFKVVEGEEFNSQAIPEKVRQRIDAQDIYIGLVTGTREHEWITAEAAYAQGKGKHVILIIEEKSGFRPTILGRDHEHIPFGAGAIEQAFIKLLGEFRSVGVSGLF